MHPIFQDLPMRELTPENFDLEVLNENSNEIRAVFFWGHDCPNCEVAKRMLHGDQARVRSLGFKWFHVNVYDHMDLGTRFGLHGIPAFFFFRNGKKLGRISPFPGMEPFMDALEKLK